VRIEITDGMVFAVVVVALIVIIVVAHLRREPNDD